MEIGDFRIDSLVSESPLGAVYIATHAPSGQLAYVYRLRPAVSDETKLVAKIHSQSQLLANLPGCPKLIDSGRLDDRTLFLALAHTPTQSLLQMLGTTTQITPSAAAQALHIAQSLTATVVAAHRRGVYHLSITPGQVLIGSAESSTPRVWLLGLGLSSLLGRSQALTWSVEHIPFAAPEQRIPGQSVGAAADVYALGVLFEQILGEHPDLGPLFAAMRADKPAERPTLTEVAERLGQAQPATPTQLNAFSPGDLSASRISSGKSLIAVSQPSDPDDPRVGKVLGNFRLTRKLGEGGMGVVYEAEHVKIGRRAAVKLLHTEFAENEQFAQRFLNEARAVNIVRHTGLVEIFDFGQMDDGTLFFVMEFLEGEALDKRIAAQHGPFPIREAMEITVQLARTLDAAHQKHIVHRDLKPANVMFVPDPVNPTEKWVKILDFGIAKVPARRMGTKSDPETTAKNTSMGTAMGTPLYMAPEQHGHAEEADEKADVFSLGIVLYELLAGVPPYQGNSLSLLTRTPKAIEQHNPKIPAALAGLLRRMIAVVPADRPSMAEITAVISKLLSRRKKQPKSVVIAAAATMVCLLGVLLWWLIPRTPPPAELRARALSTLSKYLRSSEPGEQRLAIAALAQSREPEGRALLEPLLAQPGTDMAVLLEAIQALGRIGNPDGQPALLSLLDHSPPPPVQLAIATALADLRHPRGIELLRRLHGDGIDTVRIQAALALVDHGDLSGTELLWKQISSGALSQKTQLHLLTRLALAGDERARQRLSEMRTELPAGESRLYTAWVLAKLGDRAGQEMLQEAALRESGEQVLAEHLLLSLGFAEPKAHLRRVATSTNLPDATRELALVALGDAADLPALADIAKLFSMRSSSHRIRAVSAGTVLEILAGESSRLAEQSLGWARSALGSDSAIVRELAVAALADLDAETAILPITQALGDPDTRVRQAAISALRKRASRAALTALLPILRDGDSKTRLAAIESTLAVTKGLRKRGDEDAVELARDPLRRAADSGTDEAERVAASGALLQLGDGSRQKTHLAGLTSSNPEVRGVAMRLAGPDPSALLPGLSDAQRGVRLAAAQRLAELNQRQALPVLRGLAESADAEGLAAQQTLRTMGEKPALPTGLAGQLNTADIPTRLAIVGLLGDVAPADAVPLLRLASLDPAGQVQRRAIESARTLYQRTQHPMLLRFLQSQRLQTDVTVRAAAAHALATVELLPPKESPEPAGEHPEKSPPPLAANSSQVLFEGDELVRLQIDRGAPFLLAHKPMSIAAGRHVVRYLGGQLEILVSAGQTLSVRIPLHLYEQLMAEGKEALNKHDLGRAQDLLERARRAMARRQVGGALQAELAFELGRLQEAKNNLHGALAEYNKALNIPSRDRKPELNSALVAVVKRLSKQAGRIEIYTMIDGRCQLTKEMLQAPGEQIISVGKGQTRSVFSQVGSTTKVSTCK